MLATKNDFHRQQLEADSNNFSALFDQLDPSKQQSLLRAQNSLSAWLNTIPVQKDHFDLSAFEFCDVLGTWNHFKTYPLLAMDVGNCSLLLLLWTVEKVAW